jgi:hypothetical protein
METTLQCGSCGADLPDRSSICPICGWDLTAAVSAPPRRSIVQILGSGGWRVLVYGAVLLLPIIGFARLRDTGPGPDLPTTLRWMVRGDGGRAAELTTIHRMHEIGAAASRYAVRFNEAFPFEETWGDELAPYATMRIRGWIPLVFFGADTGSAPASVREIYEIRQTDGWGRRYSVTTRFLERGQIWEDDPVVADDLAAGLQARFHTVDRPALGDGDWLRLELVSGGADGELDSEDDLRFVSYSLIAKPLRIVESQDRLSRELDRRYTIGPQYFRLEGSEHDFIDARLLAEYRLTSVY